MGTWGPGIFSSDVPADQTLYIEDDLIKRLNANYKDHKNEWADQSYFQGTEKFVATLWHYVNWVNNISWRVSEKVPLLKYVETIENLAEMDRKQRFPEDFYKKRSKILKEFAKHIRETINLSPRNVLAETSVANKMIGKIGYHLTLEKKLPSIRRIGLIPKTPPAGWLGNKKGVYFSNSFDKCLRWKNYVCQHDLRKKFVVLSFELIEEDRQVFVDNRNHLLGDYYVDHLIVPSRIKGL